MDSNVAIDATAHLVNSRLISDNQEQILNMNKRMKVRRKSRRLPSSFPSSSPFSSSTTATALRAAFKWVASQTRITSSAPTTTTTTKTIFISLLTLCHLLGFTLCIGKCFFYFFSFPSVLLILRVCCRCECMIECVNACLCLPNTKNQCWNRLK